MASLECRRDGLALEAADWGIIAEAVTANVEAGGRLPPFGDVTPMNPIRLLIADDHTLMRASMRALLERVPEVEVVAEAGDGREALQLIATHRPDIVLMDITRRAQWLGSDGACGSGRIRLAGPARWCDRLPRENAATAELALAINAVMRGEPYLSPPISTYVIARYLQRTSGERDWSRAASTPYEQLTSRQREILQLVVEGYTTKDIAQRLDLSTNTVETHRTQIMQHLDIVDGGRAASACRTFLLYIPTPTRARGKPLARR